MTPYLGLIQLFSFDWAPTGWMLCQGQQLPVQQYQALFSLLSNQYGGDGQNNFNLPNLAGRTPWGTNVGAKLGATGGMEMLTLTEANMPQHTHLMAIALECNTANATTSVPTNAYLAVSDVGNFYNTTSQANTYMAPPQVTIGSVGGVPIDCRSPFIVLNYCISSNGVYPPRQ